MKAKILLFLFSLLNLCVYSQNDFKDYNIKIECNSGFEYGNFDKLNNILSNINCSPIEDNNQSLINISMGFGVIPKSSLFKLQILFDLASTYFNDYKYQSSVDIYGVNLVVLYKISLKNGYCLHRLEYLKVIIM